MHMNPSSEQRFDSGYWQSGVLIAVAAVVFFLQLGNSRFWDQDEGYYATVASEMYRRGDWIVPTFNEELFAHKPPMMYWGMLTSFSLFGVSEFAARLPSACFGLGSALLLAWLGRRMFDRTIGFYAALVLLSSFMFSVVSRSATADAHLTFFVLLAFCFWVRDAFPLHGDNPGNGTANAWNIRWSSWIAAYAAMGLAVLTKGPIGVAFPVTILGFVHLLDRNSPSRLLAVPGQGREWILGVLRTLHPVHVVKTIWSMRPITAVVMVAGIAGPWFFAMQWITGGEFLMEFLGVHHFTRFSQPMDNHSGPIFYYLLVALIGLYPWTAFALPTCLQWLRRVDDPRAARAHLLVTAWVLVYLSIFSIASTKLPNYIMPAFPALSLILGHYVQSWATDTTHSGLRWQWIGWSCMFGIGCLLIVIPSLMAWDGLGASVLDRWQIDDAMQRTVQWLGLLGLPLVVGGCLGCALLKQQHRQWLGPCMGAVGICMMLLFWQTIVPMADRHQTPQDIATSLPEMDHEVGSDGPIAVLGYFRPSMVYYAGRPIHFCKNNEELLEQLSAAPNSLVVVKQGSLEAIEADLPEGYRIVRAFPEFPKKGTVVVLGNTLAR